LCTKSYADFYKKDDSKKALKKEKPEATEKGKYQPLSLPSIQKVVFITFNVVA
jgi:hypothetical protein